MAQATRVKGKANIGDKVSYFDMANQDGIIYEVISEPTENVDAEYGWSKGYGLFSQENGITYSDLRQHGWSFE